MRMRKGIFIITLCVLFNLSLTAENIKVDYKVDFGIVGEIGIAHANLKKDGNSYEIDIKLEATGITKLLSGDRKEEHISKGHIVNGLLVSDFYHIKKRHGEKMRDIIYKINHNTERVVKIDKKWKNGKLYKEREKVMPYYSKDDLLTLYFNLNRYIKDKNTSKDYKFKAIGAEIQKGLVDIHIPNRDELEEYRDLLGEDENSWYAKAIVYQKIFSSDKGELLLKIGKNDGITQKAVLKDLLLFGDVRAYKIAH